MDQDGLFLMLSMCNACRTGKGSWKKCMGKRHNPRLWTVSHDRMSFAYRQCVKPDQTMTIYKLRNHETNEEFLEFSEDIVFQTPCAACSNIKACLQAGHRLLDWKPSSPVKVPDVRSSTDDNGFASQGAQTGRAPSSSPRGSNPGGTKNAFIDRGKTGSVGGTQSSSMSGAGNGVGRPDKVGSGQGKARGKALPEADRGSETSGGVPMMPKGSHKRKSPGALAMPPSKNDKVSSPRSSGSSESSQDKTVKRAAKDRRCPSGGAKRRKKLNSSDNSVSTLPIGAEEEVSYYAKTDDVANEKFDDSSSDTSAAEIKPNHLTPSPPPRQLTIAEKLEAAKREEAALLKEFQATHDNFYKDEEARRLEMAEFIRAGEAAITKMREKKEATLRWISERRKKIAAERATLVQQRIMELEAEQAEARQDALDREARLQAEKEALAAVVRGHERPGQVPFDSGVSWRRAGEGARSPSTDAPTKSSDASTIHANTRSVELDVAPAGRDYAMTGNVVENGTDRTQKTAEGVINGVRSKGHQGSFPKEVGSNANGAAGRESNSDPQARSLVQIAAKVGTGDVNTRPETEVAISCESKSRGYVKDESARSCSIEGVHVEQSKKVDQEVGASKTNAIPKVELDTNRRAAARTARA